MDSNELKGRHMGRPKVAVKKKQYTLTLKPELYQKSREEANRRGISFSALVAIALEDYIKNHSKEDHKK